MWKGIGKKSPAVEPCSPEEGDAYLRAVAQLLPGSCQLAPDRVARHIGVPLVWPQLTCT